MLRAVPNAIVVTVVVLLAGSGCAYGEVRHVVRSQFAAEVDCAEVQVERKGLAYLPDDSGKDRYKVVGCGVERTYTCPRDAGLVSYDDEALCTWVEGDSDRPQAATASEGVQDPFADGASGTDTAGGEATESVAPAAADEPDAPEEASEPAAPAEPTVAPAAPAASEPKKGRKRKK
jgi:hypothetical protein